MKYAIALFLVLMVSAAVLADAPVAVNDSYTVDEDTTLAVAANGVLANDIHSGAFTAARATAPTHGTLTLNADGSFTYVPAANFQGMDSFTYTANDGALNSSPATVTITITAVNDAPVISNPSPATPTSVNEGMSQTFSITASDVDGDTLTYTWMLDGTRVATGSSFTSFTYTAPQVTANTPHTLTVSVSDGPVERVFSWTLTVNNLAPALSSEEQRYDALVDDFDSYENDYRDFKREYRDAVSNDDESKQRRYENKLEDLEDTIKDLQDDIDNVQEDVQDLSPRNRSLEDDVNTLQDDTDQLLKDVRDVLDTQQRDTTADSYVVSQPVSTSSNTASTALRSTPQKVVYQAFTLPAEALVASQPESPPSILTSNTSLFLALILGGILLVAVAITMLLLMLRR